MILNRGASPFQDALLSLYSTPLRNSALSRPQVLRPCFARPRSQAGVGRSRGLTTLLV